RLSRPARRPARSTIRAAASAGEAGRRRRRRRMTAAETPGATTAPAAGPGPMHQVFDTLREHVAIGVDRISLSVMLAPDAGREAQQATMQAVADAERAADTSLAAIRVLGFLPPPAGHGEHPSGMRMIPFAILSWQPRGGWNALTAASARAPHSTDVLFVTDLPNHQPVPGAGQGR
ncbi:MAG: hypothetical protein B7Z72_12380, partial [Gemmatimonadetes bacterium 21-71-4]